MTTTHKIKTWTCSNSACNYHQDFDPNDLEKMKLIFPNVPVGQCPACYQGQSKATDPKTHARMNNDMKLENDTNKQIKINILTNEEIDKINVDDLTKMKTTNGKLKTQAAKERTKYNSPEWKA